MDPRDDYTRHKEVERIIKGANKNNDQWVAESIPVDNLGSHCAIDL